MPSTTTSSGGGDILSQMIPFLDPHLSLHLLDFASEKNLYDQNHILKAKYQILLNTKRIEETNDVYQKLNNDNMSGLAEKKTSHKREEDRITAAVSPLLAIIQDPAFTQQWKQDKNLRLLKEKFKLTEEMIQTLYDFAMVQYDSKDYSVVSQALYHYNFLSLDSAKLKLSYWGKLAADILSADWDSANDDVFALRDLLEESVGNVSLNSTLLYQRSWLMHWALFVFFKHARGKESLVDLFMTPAYLNAIQTACPWLLRYLGAALISSKRRKNQLKEFVQIIQVDAYTSQDPLLQFIFELHINFNFDAAQRKLKECDAVITNDYFLNQLHSDFLSSARHALFEVYCRIHQTIDIKNLSSKLNLGEKEGEKWIVNLIRDAKMDAKIDSSTNTVRMNVQYETIYQQVMEKTKALGFRSSLLASNIEKREVELASRSGIHPQPKSQKPQRKEHS